MPWLSVVGIVTSLILGYATAISYKRNSGPFTIYTVAVAVAIMAYSIWNMSSQPWSETRTGQTVNRVTTDRDVVGLTVNVYTVEGGDFMPIKCNHLTFTWCPGLWPGDKVSVHRWTTTTDKSSVHQEVAGK